MYQQILDRFGYKNTILSLSTNRIININIIAKYMTKGKHPLGEGPQGERPIGKKPISDKAHTLVKSTSLGSIRKAT